LQLRVLLIYHPAVVFEKIASIVRLHAGDDMKRVFYFRLLFLFLLTTLAIPGCGELLCEAPVFSPVPGTYNSDQHVSLSTTTEGAAIYYTTDGTAPTTGSTLYSSAIPVTGNGTTITIKAIAVKSGMKNSSVASGTFAISSSAGTLQWTWVSGDSINNQAGVYGAQGSGSASSKPGARNGGMSWIDSSGALWIFGGEGIDSSGNSGLLNDLWKYDPGTGQWTWVSGSGTISQTGVYGAQGTGSSSVLPGSRVKGVTWIDVSGNLWLFGGTGYAAANYGALNDLWKFNPSTGIWTWVSGDNTANLHGIYGTLGTAAVLNKPGARSGSVSWIDSSGNLWLFGGDGYSASSTGELNDLWKFDTSTGEWTWVSGDAGIDQPGVYGTKGTAVASNKPGSRDGSVSWVDASGRFWLFGGNGIDANGNIGALNDLWRFDPSTVDWTWISGDGMFNQSGIYGTKGSAAASTKPGARDGSASWIDSSNDLWLFGGNGFDAGGNGGLMNDLWKFNPSTGQWSWVSGSNGINQSSVFGTKGTANSTNMPGSRDNGVSWLDSSGTLWLFGGAGLDAAGNSVLFNDLWKFQP
jgi:N-acetylneuraminic acid mutarotase